MVRSGQSAVRAEVAGTGRHSPLARREHVVIGGPPQHDAMVLVVRPEVYRSVSRGHGSLSGQ